MQQFFKFVKNLYSEIPRNLNTIFNYKPIVRVADLNNLNLDQFLNESFSSFQVITDSSQTVSPNEEFIYKNRIVFIITRLYC